MVEIECANSQIVAKLKTLKLIKVQDAKKQRSVISILKIIEKIGTLEAQNQFFPIFLSKDGKKFLGVGETLPYPIPWQEYKNEDDRITIWPLKPDGSEGCWQISQDSFLKSCCF